MSKPLKLVSNSADPFRDPQTPSGVHLTQLADWEVPGLMVHECGYLHRAVGWNFANVISPFWRLYHNPQPGNYILWRQQRIELTPKCVVIVPADCLFECHSQRGLPHLWIHFTINPSHAFETGAPFSIPVNPLLQMNLTLLKKACLKRTTLMEQRTLAHAGAAVLHTCFALHPPQLRRSLPARLQNILKVIQNSSAVDVSKQSFARQACMSEETFRRWFKQHLHCTPGQYVRQVRVQHACRLLAFSDQSIEQIAQETGFPNRHYFTRVFTNEMHCSPAAFRKQREHAGSDVISS